MKTPHSPFHAEVCSIVAERHLLKHPFYVAWSAGQLSREDLRRYAGQYLHHVLAEPTYLSAVHSNTPHLTRDGKTDLRARQTILRNLIDEEFGPKNHPELWKCFARALGSTDDDLASCAPFPNTQALIQTFTRICRDRPYYAGLGALHAFESQVPEIAAVKIEGLRRFYGITDPADYEFFSVHEQADVEHSSAEWSLIEAAADTSEKREDVLGATREACDALWSFLSGVHEGAQSETVNA
ncbi:MAG: CADD family putative folate metabolism protein [Candidatus Baltobacteraceae bacterium]